MERALNQIVQAQPTLDAGATSDVFNGVRLSTRLMPALQATRGGDWCETFVVSPEVVALSIGDVCGHGPGTFETMVAMRQVVHDAALRGLDPGQTLAAANHTVCERDPDLHVTAILALLDTHRSTLTFANAGHPPPLAIGPGGARFITYADSDLPLGVVRALVPALHVVTLPPRTLVVLYTDGVTEHERQPLRGEAQLRKAAQSAYKKYAFPTALVIEELMLLTKYNPDDASILTALVPRKPRRSADVTSRLRRRRLRAYLNGTGRTQPAPSSPSRFSASADPPERWIR
jgi:serine phosphatase RsbU (regulator of sigma subunit)